MCEKVKPNVGHMEGASGLTSVIKAVLSLEHRQIPPNIYFETPHPQSKFLEIEYLCQSPKLTHVVPFQEGKLEVPIDTLPWPEDKEARVSVNSFGIGGANAHVSLLTQALTPSALRCSDVIPGYTRRVSTARHNFGTKKTTKSNTSFISMGSECPK